jgi:hypothetical protein
MLPGLLLLLSVTAQQDPYVYTLAHVYDTAMEYLEAGQLELAYAAFSEIVARMPHLGRARYDAAGVASEMESWAGADSLLAPGELGVEPDSTASAEAAVLLGSSISAGDYGGVERALGMLRERILDGAPFDCDLTNYEVALNWLRNNEPPEDQSQDQSEDQQDQSEDQQDQSEDQQDQSEDQQDQSEDQQDQSEDQQDQSEDQQEAPPPPSQGEMTEEDAQRILDLVDEAEPTDEEGAKGYTTTGPVW